MNLDEYTSRFGYDALHNMTENVRIVRPETGGAKVHYMFVERGSFVGTF